MTRVRATCAVILLSILTLGSAAPLTCAGWESAASDRMACCKRAAHERCADQSAADACCAGQEQGRQRATGVSAVHAAAPVLAPAVFVPALAFFDLDGRATRHFAPSSAHPLHGPPGLLATPLRI